METLIEKLVARQPVTDKDIADELSDICYREHSTCNSTCPVYAKNGGAVGADKPFDVNRGCDCFKSGRRMLAFLRGEPFP